MSSQRKEIIGMLNMAVSIIVISIILSVLSLVIIKDAGFDEV